MAEAMPGNQPAPTMEDFAAFEQLRQEVSPSEFNETMLATAAEADPMAVAEFKSELRDLDLPPEVLDLMNTMVDEILASPERYAEIRAHYLTQDMSEELLPETFDAEFFGALNMAIDEIRATSGVPNLAPQGFARGGVASLRPIPAAMLARHGRNGDTQLAHVTPEEMGLLRSRGGSGSTNPVTGLPEFFSLSKIFKKIARAVKKFARSTIGKIVIGTALFFIAGPLATQMFGTFGSAAVAAAQGFIAGAGSSLLAGNSLKDSLKMGAIGAITAGAFTAATQGAAAFEPLESAAADAASSTVATEQLAVAPETLTPTSVDSGIAAIDTGAGTTSPPISTGAVDTSALTGPIPEVTLPTPLSYTPRVPGTVSLDALNPASGSSGVSSGAATANNARIAALRGGQSNALTQAPPTFLDRLTAAPGKAWDMISPGAIRDRGAIAAQEAGSTAFRDTMADYASQGIVKGAPGFTDAVGAAIKSQNAATLAATPGMIAQYGPAAAAGMGVMGLMGGFSAQEPEVPPGFEDMMGGDFSPGQRLAELYPDKYKLKWGGVDTLSTSTPNPYVNYVSSYKAARGSSPQGVAPQHYPEMDGPINGPGNGTSDDVPAMLSDGEFVFTAKAVRSMGKGSRRKGAKKMYALMKKLEGAS
jgi:hypothetical protein